MAQRLESTSGLQMGSNFLPIQEGSQPGEPSIGLTRHLELPEHYGVPLLELLVVDPQFIFISWEITPQQLDEARARFGEHGFHHRRLQVILMEGLSGRVLTTRELYGEIGRWFIQLGQPGIWLRAELVYRSGDDVVSLNTAGPVFVPRNTPIEPDRYEELHVTYGRGPTGELTLERADRERPRWPRITLAGQRGATSGDLDSHLTDGLPSSAAPFSLAPLQQRVDSRLLRPLLPVAPAAIQESEDD